MCATAGLALYEDTHAYYGAVDDYNYVVDQWGNCMVTQYSGNCAGYAVEAEMKAGYASLEYDLMINDAADFEALGCMIG